MALSDEVGVIKKQVKELHGVVKDLIERINLMQIQLTSLLPKPESIDKYKERVEYPNRTITYESEQVIQGNKVWKKNWSNWSRRKSTPTTRF